VATLGRHEANVSLAEIIKYEFIALLCHRACQHSRELTFKSVFSCLEAIVIVEIATFLPVLLLSVVDNIANDGTLVGTATTTPCVTQIHNRVGEVVL